MSQDEASQQLERLQQTIFSKIRDIRYIINDQDRWVAQQIALKKQSSSQLLYPKFDKKACYYQEFWKIYLFNEIMISKIKDYSISNKQISLQLQDLQQAEKEWAAIWAQKSKKKIRRTSDMIQKVFDCPFENCGKNYGSDVSLNLHMKLKHNSGTKTQRQTLARQICLAQQRGQIININLTFPPGYLQSFKEGFRKQIINQ